MKAAFYLLAMAFLLPMNSGWTDTLPMAPHPSSGSTAPPEQETFHNVTTQQLNRAIGDTLRHPDYAWRLPRHFTLLNDNDRQSFLMMFLHETGRSIARMTLAVVRFIRFITDWLKRLFPESQPRDLPESRWQISVQVLLFLCLAITAVLLAVFFWRYARHHLQKQASVATVPVISATALLDETATASSLPSDEWMKIADALIKNGNLRLALRALFLASLTHLGQVGLLSISRGKSNREYQYELERRAHDATTLLAAFRRNTSRLERSWYGRHEVTSDILAAFLADHSTIMPLSAGSNMETSFGGQARSPEGAG